MISPILFFFLKIAEAIWGHFWFCINFWNICSRSVKYAIGILIGIVLNLQVALDTMDILMMVLFQSLNTVYALFYFILFTFMSNIVYS